MSSPPDASLTDRLSPSLSRTSISESSTAYPHQNLPRRTHSERSQQRPSHHYGRDNDLPPLPTPEMSAEARRQSIMAMDRKRRLTTSSQETGRRRTTTGGFTSRDNRFYHTPPRHNSQSSISPTGPSAFTEVIDLTGSSPPTAMRPSVPPRANRTSSTGSRGYIVPSWQPDTEVSECPICKRQFTFLFRRHHCRKCGRVVCNECSPHRITIPRQYIVHPPGEEEHGIFPDANIVDLTRDDDDNVGHGTSPLRINSGLDGGEKVRLCNPCVPDPQPELQSIFDEPTSRPLPPAPPANSSLFPAQASIPGFSRYAPQVLPPARSSHARDQPLPQLPHPGTRVHIESDEEDDELGSSLEAYHNSAGRRVTSPPFQSRYHPSSHSHSRYHSLDAGRPPPPPIPPFPFNNHPRMLSMLEASRRHQHPYGPSPFPGLPSLPSHLPSSSSSAAPRPPRPRIREEDMCPVCRGILPPRGPNNDETARETHIMECISQHDTSASATPPTQLLQQRTRSSTQTHTFSTTNPTPGFTPPISASLPTSPPPTRVMPMQMLRFIATEKDCGVKSEGDAMAAGENGVDVQPQECSICMVEYEVGERLARLECWCKFHEQCIVEWFGRKRECPVHKLS